MRIASFLERITATAGHMPDSNTTIAASDVAKKIVVVHDARESRAYAAFPSGLLLLIGCVR